MYIFNCTVSQEIVSQVNSVATILEVEPGKNGGEMAPCFYAMKLPL